MSSTDLPDCSLNLRSCNISNISTVKSHDWVTSGITRNIEQGQNILFPLHTATY